MSSITVSNVLQQMTPKDINRVAVYLSKQFCTGVSRDKFFYQCHWYSGDSAQITLALAIWKTLWEIREFGQLKTHPEDLLRRCAANIRTYECRRYPYALALLCRAFARQFGDFDELPRKIFDGRHERWRFYDYSDEATAKLSDYAPHKIFIQKTSLEHFGKYMLCEQWFNEVIHGVGENKMQVNVVPFDGYDEAALFLAQLVDLLNTDGDPDCPAAAQFIRDVLAQAPVEKMRMEERKAAERAKCEAAMRDGVHVYILQMDNNTIKIGMSNNVRQRIAAIEQGGLDVVKFGVTQQGFKESKAREIEAACHAHFWDRRKKREYFFITYDEAKDFLQTFSPVIEPDVD